jgi:hypothetical protein
MKQTQVQPEATSGVSTSDHSKVCNELVIVRFWGKANGYFQC